MKFTAKGRIRLLRDGVEISQHVVPEEAYERAYAHAQANGPGKYIVRYPDREVDLSTLTRVVFNPDTTAPSVPLGVTVSPISQTTLRVTWSASADTGGSGLAGYRVYRATASDGPYAQVGSDLSTASLTYDDTSLSAGTTRYYRVAAFDGNGNVSAQSTVASGTTPAPSTSFDYYISTTGSDSNPGTLSQPWALTAINSKRATYAGRSVGLLDGTYDFASLFTLGSATGEFEIWLQVAGGSSGSPTIIKAVNARQAVLDFNRAGHANPRRYAAIGSNGQSWVVFDGLKIVRGNYQSILLYGANDCTVKNCEIDDNDYAYITSSAGQNASPLRMVGCERLLIQNNYIHNFKATADGGRSPGMIAIQGGAHSDGISDSVIEYNTIIVPSGASNQHANCIHLKNAVNNNNIVRYNYLDTTNAGDAAIKWHTGSGTSGTEDFHNNIAVSNTPFYTEGTSRKRRIWNNTMICLNGGSDGDDAGVRLWQDAGVDYYNNILFSATAPERGHLNIKDTSQPDVWDYNFYGDGNPELLVKTGDYSTYTSTFAAWKSGSGKDANSIQGADAGFVATGSGPSYYTLSGGSACKDAGKSDGTSGGSTVDMGAWGNGATQIGADFVSY